METSKKFKSSEVITQLAREIYEVKTGKPLLSYQTATNDCYIEAVLRFLDRYLPEVDLFVKERVIQLDENDHQPRYVRRS